MAEVKIELAVNTETGTNRISAFNQHTKSAMDQIKAAGTDASTKIESAFKQLGVRSIASMNEEKRAMAAAWVEIKQSGIASVADIQRAKEAFVARTKVLNKEIVTATKDATDQVGTIWSSVAGKLTSTWAWMKQSWIGIMTAIGAAAATIRVITDMAREAYYAEIAFNKLKIQVENLGVSYDIVGDRVEQAIEKTSRYARVQDDDVAKVLQELVLQTGNLEGSIGNLNIVYDLAYQKGIDAGEAARIIGMIQEGHVETLGRLIPKLRGMNEALGENATVAQKAAWAMRVIEEDVAGASEKMTEHEKKVRDLSNAWKDFSEVAGGIFINIADALFTQPIQAVGNIKQNVVNIWNSLLYGQEAARKMANEVNQVGNAAKTAGESAAEMAKKIKAASDQTERQKEAAKALEEENKRIRDLQGSIVQELVNTETQIIQLRDGEAAYLEAIRARQIAQGGDVALVDILISKQKELNDLKKQGELDKLIAETQKRQGKDWKPVIDIPTAPAFAPGERDAETERMKGVDPIEDKHKNAASWIKEEIELMKALTGQYGENAQALVASTIAQETLFAIKQAMISAVAQEILGQHNYGKALQNATAQALASVAARMAVEAIYMTGIGIAALTPWGAALYGPAPFWFKAAAYMGTRAVAAGVMAQALYRPPSQKEQQSREELEATQPPANIDTSSKTESRPSQIVNVYVNGNLVDMNQLARELRYYNVQLVRDTI